MAVGGNKPGEVGTRCLDRHLLAEHHPQRQLCLVNRAWDALTGGFGDQHLQVVVGAQRLDYRLRIGVEIEQPSTTGNRGRHVAEIIHPQQTPHMIRSRCQAHDSAAEPEPQRASIRAVTNLFATGYRGGRQMTEYTVAATRATECSAWRVGRSASRSSDRLPAWIGLGSLPGRGRTQPGCTGFDGLVRLTDQLNDNTLITLGARRIVVATTPETDNTDLLRTVVQLVRLAAIAFAQRDNTGEIRTAEEKIDEALATLSKIDSIEKTAGLISKSAIKIGSESGALRTEITRLLKQAATALIGAKADGDSDVAA